MSGIRDVVVQMVRDELASQDTKWGAGRHLEARTWMAILMEEVGEVARADLEREPVDRAIEEWVQVAAVAMAAVEDALTHEGWRSRGLPDDAAAEGFEHLAQGLGMPADQLVNAIVNAIGHALKDVPDGHLATSIREWMQTLADALAGIPPEDGE